MTEERPWTPGPWIFDGLTIRTEDPAATHDDRVVYSGVRSGLHVGDHDAALIALAPEMAAAILWGACDAFNADTGEHECGCPLCVIAHKLRAILA